MGTVRNLKISGGQTIGEETTQILGPVEQIVWNEKQITMIVVEEPQNGVTRAEKRIVEVSSGKKI